MMKTLQEAREELEKNLTKGTTCPCCDQFAKVYKRKLNSSMVICLYELNKVCSTGNFYHIHELTTRSELFMLNMHGGNFATMKYWDLIEEMPKENETTASRTSGFWRITEKGKDFLLGKISVPKYAFTFNMSLIKFSEDQVTFKECLKNHFNFQEIMSA